MTIAAAILLVGAARDRLALAVRAAHDRPFLILALLNNVIPFCLFAWAQQQIASGLASILNATTPIWAVLVAHFLTADEKATPLKVAGVLIGFAGVAVMIGGDLLLDIGGAGLLAQLACLVATLCYALAGVYARRFRLMGVSPIAVSTGQLGAAALGDAAAGAAVRAALARRDAARPRLIASILALALFCTASPTSSISG